MTQDEPSRPAPEAGQRRVAAAVRDPKGAAPPRTADEAGPGSFPSVAGPVLSQADLDPVLRDAVRACLAGLPAQAPAAVAVSGGADSSMLAVYAAHVAREQGRELHLLHVHHGLQADADEWAERVQALAGLLGAPLASLCVAVDTGDGTGVEAAARTARYAALSAQARGIGAAAVLLAHHRHDQAETVLLRLLRGAGPSGMAAMAAETWHEGARYLRPWLDIGRGAVLAAAQRWADRTGWHPVADPTNQDPRYTRAAVRTMLAPVLDVRWPGWRDILARHARQATEAAGILDEVARADFARLEPAPDDRSFALAPWRELAAPHQTLVLRHWFARNGVRMPTEARLAELARQLRQLHALGHDRQMLFEHGPVRVRCVRGRVLLEPRPAGRGRAPRAR